MTVLLTLHAAAKLTSSGSTVRSTLPSWTTSGALVVDIGSFRAMTQVISVSAGGEALPADEARHSGRGSTAGTLARSSSGHLLHFYRTACAPWSSTRDESLKSLAPRI